MIAYFRAAWWRRLAAASHEHYRIGASLFRICAGLTILYQYLITYYQRHFLYGPDGIVPYDWFKHQLSQTGSFSIYALDDSLVVFETIFHLGIVITILWVLGWHTRVMTFLTWVFLWSLHQRNPVLWDGGDNLVQIVLIYAFFANLGATCSIDAAMRRPQRCADTTAQQMLALFHNAAVLAMAMQLCLVYGTAGLYKVQGELWQNGTALYYILRVGEFAWTGYGAKITQQSTLITMLTYSTVAFQVSFPFLFFMHRITRRLALVLGIGFHLGIGLVMGLMSFATFLISIELMFISDRDYHTIIGVYRHLWHVFATCWEWMRRWLRSCQHSDLPQDG
jgi:antimicrobial peptide system SdpB family protein